MILGVAPNSRWGMQISFRSKIPVNLDKFMENEVPSGAPATLGTAP